MRNSAAAERCWPFEQALAVLSYFAVKPTYMLLSLVIVAMAWPADSVQTLNLVPFVTST